MSHTATLFSEGRVAGGGRLAALLALFAHDGELDSSGRGFCDGRVTIWHQKGRSLDRERKTLYSRN